MVQIVTTVLNQQTTLMFKSLLKMTLMKDHQMIVTTMMIATTTMTAATMIATMVTVMTIALKKKTPNLHLHKMLQLQPNQQRVQTIKKKPLLKRLHLHQLAKALQHHLHQHQLAQLSQLLLLVAHQLSTLMKMNANQSGRNVTTTTSLVKTTHVKLSFHNVAVNQYKGDCYQTKR